MSFDHYYPNRKDWRKPYYRSARWDWTCRNGGSCNYCSDRRQFANKRREPIVSKEDIALLAQFGRAAPL